jgi:predicted nucleic acid-binding protein
MILYLDTSSLIKLYVAEPGTKEVQTRVRESDVVATSVIAYPEAHAALARRQREGFLSKTELKTVLEEFRNTWGRLVANVLSSPVFIRAGSLAVTYGLRGMDGIHLSSWVELLHKADRVDFMSHDVRLVRAASKEFRKQKQ